MDPEILSLMSSPWLEARPVLIRLLALLVKLPTDQTRAICLEMVTARADTAAALWLAERIVDLEVPAAAVIDEAADTSWTDQISLGLAGISTVGALSMGTSTRRVLETLATITADSLTVVCSSTVVTRGLEDLGLEVVPGDPATADACLIPVAATQHDTLWTSATAATSYFGCSSPVVLADPVTSLGSWAGGLYRPPDWVVRVG
jgi:hypothetical protein